MIRIIPFLISVTILGLIYWQINFNIILENILQSDMLWLVVGIAMVVPITMFTALRLAWLSPSKLTYFDSLKLILAASAMNVVLPSKMGDVVKGFFISVNLHVYKIYAFFLIHQVVIHLRFSTFVVFIDSNNTPPNSFV